MPRKLHTNQAARPQTKRTTITIDWVIWEAAVELMRVRGFNNNFSSYVADLIRRDKERHQQ